MKSNRKITSSEKNLFLVTGFAVVFIVAVGAWRQYVDAIPQVDLPTQKMPSPNAYDFYVKAGVAIIPANPAVDAVHDSNSVPKAQWKTHYPTAKKEAWLRGNATTLKLLRQGFKYPCRVAPRRSFNFSGFKSWAHFRSIARMLTIESHAHSERGNWNGAAQSTLDALQLGHDISKGGVLIDYLFGAAINAIGRREAWEILPHLNAEEAKSAARRLEKIMDDRALFADILREEKYYGQADLLKMMKSREWRAMDLNEATGLKRLSERWQMFKTPHRVVFNNYTNYMDALIEHAQKPYDATAAAPAIPTDIYNQSLAPSLSLARWSYARDEAGNSLALVALALRIYKFEHNRYPQTLNELVPLYLKKIPADAYGAGEPLRYKIKGAEYSLYSVGPDGIDNNGRVIEDSKISRKKRNRFLVQQQSKGDYVASINY